MEVFNVHLSYLRLNEKLDLSFKTCFILTKWETPMQLATSRVKLRSWLEISLFPWFIALTALSGKYFTRQMQRFYFISDLRNIAKLVNCLNEE